MFHAFKDVITYVVEKRFFVSIQKEHHKREIVVDSEVKEGSEVFVHRPITIRNDFRVAGKLKLGNDKNVISDKNGKLLHTKLAKEKAADGDMLGFNFGICLPVKIKDVIHIQPRSTEKINIHGKDFYGDLLNNNRLFYDFILPSTYIGNELTYNIYFISENIETKTISFNHSIYSSDKFIPAHQEVHTSSIKMKKGINVLESFRTNIMNEEEGDFNFYFANKMMRLEIGKNSKFGHTNTLQSNVYFLGAKVEFNTNQYNEL